MSVVPSGLPRFPPATVFRVINVWKSYRDFASFTVSFKGSK